MKAGRHTSLAHLHLLSPKKRYIIIILLIAAGLKTSSMFSRPLLTHNIICLPFSSRSARLLENSFLSAAQPVRQETYFFFACPTWPIGKITSHFRLSQQARPGTCFGAGPGPCRPQLLSAVNYIAAWIGQISTIICTAEKSVLISKLATFDIFPK